jgi:adenosylcobinamide kinase/adenosylcobinamide-phosphate guanylyltransferase
MGKLIFILGGARSGKSSYAVKLARQLSKKVVFVATAISQDKEMRKRIKLHRISRPKEWKLIEEGKEISSILPKLGNKYEIILIDCLGLAISNFLADGLKDRQIQTRIKRLLADLLKVNLTTILVSNEVGSGVVPTNLLARRFRDLMGLANQMIAKKADEVILMQAGIPIKISALSL